MAYDLIGRSLTPLSELISEADFPLADFLPVKRISPVFKGIFFTEADIAFDGENYVVSAHLAFNDSIEFGPAGSDSFSLVLASALDGWTTLRAIFVIGPDLAMHLEGVSFGVRVSKSVLRDVRTGEGAEILVSGDLTLLPEGLKLSNSTSGNLAPAYLGGTEIVVKAEHVLPVFGSGEAPAFLADTPEFEGVAFEKLSVSIPLDTNGESSLQAEMRNTVIGTTGFTGKVRLSPKDLPNHIPSNLFGFQFRFREFSIELVENSLVEAVLAVDLRLKTLESSTQEKWIGLDISFGGEGAPRFAAALSATQPPQAGRPGEDLATVEFDDIARIGIRGLRLECEDDLCNLFFTGNLQFLIDGATEWPRMEFEEIGVSSDGRILLPEGGGIVFCTPLVAQWYFVRLTVAKFRFGRPDGRPDDFQFSLSAEVKLIDGLPAGASIDGLTITWGPENQPDIALRGLGISFGVPGSFAAETEISYVKENGVVLFRGRGALELYPLDMAIDVGILVGEDTSESGNAFTFLYLFADAKLLPTGIPIGSTGLSIYGFQGLVAYNMALDVNPDRPVDERYYELFISSPIGITHLAKWQGSPCDNALAAGIILGTADKGFAFNVKGLVTVAFPDLTLLLQAKAQLLQKKPELGTQSQGSLQALMIYAAADRALTFDIMAQWGLGNLFAVGGRARALFSFADSSAWYLEIGRNADNQRFRAQVLKWGNKWLFSAGFWLRLDDTKLVTGLLAQFELRASTEGFFVEAVGRARAEMVLYWEPPQWEGEAALSGRISAGYRGISIGITLSGKANMSVADPFELRLRIKACFRALFWKICKGHTFKWIENQQPVLEPPIRLWSATPRHWTPILDGTPQPVGDSSNAKLKTGRVTLLHGEHTADVAPHSVLSLDFGKPMHDVTERLNDAAQLHNDGFITIGRYSGYNARYSLDKVQLFRCDRRTKDWVEVDIWGTWAKETLDQNTTLRLFSSERFGHDGSLSESFCEDIELDYCVEPIDTKVCVSLAGIEPGFGELDDGSRFHWLAKGKECIVLGRDDELIICPPRGIEEIKLKVVPSSRYVHRYESSETAIWWKTVQVRKDGTAVIPGIDVLGNCIVKFCYFVESDETEFCVSLAGIKPGIGQLTHGSSYRWDAPEARRSGKCIILDRCDELIIYPPPGIKKIDLKAVPNNRYGDRYVLREATDWRKTIPVDEDGAAVILGEDVLGNCIVEFCYFSGHAPREMVGETRRGKIVTENEYWKVGAKRSLLQPDTEYYLKVIHTRSLRRVKNEPARESEENIAYFRTLGPPREAGALTNYVVGTYPAHGARPVYLGYDFIVRFVEDYVPCLYTLAEQQLATRLVDSQGEVVKNEHGEPVLIPASRLGRIEQRVSEREWERKVQREENRNCIMEAQKKVGKLRETVLGMTAPPHLLANSQYVAELVAIGANGTSPPLYQWTFTTARYRFFSSMIDDTSRTLSTSRVVISTPTFEDDFDTAIRRLGAPSVAYFEKFTATPYLDVDRRRCVAILLEAPEPLETGLRLDVTVAGSETHLIANLDETRVVVLRQDDADWPAGNHEVKLTWKREPNDIDEAKRLVTDSKVTNSDPEIPKFSLQCGKP